MTRMNKARIAAKIANAMNEKRLLPLPTELPSFKEEAAKAVPVSKMVEDFIAGPIKKAILATKMTYNQKKNVLEGRTSVKELPTTYYDVKDDFNTLFHDMMAVEGYNASISHDGGGLYAVAYINWSAAVEV